MKKARLTAALLLIAMLSGCGNQESMSEGTTSADQDTKEETSADTTVKDDLPDDLDFSGRELRILTSNNTKNAVLVPEESTGDILNDAMYDRNMKICDRFGITITEEAITWDSARDKARNTISAGDDAYDLISLIDREALNFAAENMIWYADDVKNINLSKPYWNQMLNENATIGGRQVLAYSDIAMTAYDFTHVMLFNKKMVGDLQLGSPYDLVSDGTWTLDKFAEYSAQATSDINGDGVYDKNDRYGFASLAKQIAPCFWIGAGCVSVKKDADDLPVFDMENERMLSVLERAYDLTWGGKDWFVQKEGDWYSNTTLFAEDQVLFCNSTFSDIFGATLREMKSDYGIIPYPKYDEAQEKYYSRVEGGCPYSIPVTVVDTAFAGAMMEAISCESYNSVIPAYYEVALKAKFTRDSQSGEILDMLMQNRVYDWGDTFFCNYVRDGFVYKAFNNGSTVSASDVESNRNAVEGAIEKTVSAITNNG